MLGAIAGDVIGSTWEFKGEKKEDFPLFDRGFHFTDDTVITIAVADVLLHGLDYAKAFKTWGRKYPHSNYGGMFQNWLFSEDSQPYNSFGNGSAMRVSPIGFAFESLEDTLEEAAKSAVVTHNHPEGIKGAQATAAAIFLARTGKSKKEIAQFITSHFGYDLSAKLADIRKNYSFDVTCQGSVPQAIIAFLESRDYEDAIRKVVSLGGDADTQACITGGIAQAFYGGVPKTISEPVLLNIAHEMRLIVQEFAQRFPASKWATGQEKRYN